ncbi:MAG: LysM peptidoglycan-binding domain-containing protein [Legionellales bacterium]|nr:LysM peptidoglycan-binding domain-containing protein [Legionellales bacterium]
MKLRVLLLNIVLLLPIWGYANVELRQGHPNHYTVKPGDTLWSISSKFLKYPWQWPLIWQNNPQITYPTELYPGDVLELHLQNGKPLMSLVSTKGTIKLTPQTRVMPLEHPIPTIPVEDILSFLSKSRVMSKRELLKAPYIISFVGEHVAGGANSEIYVRSIPSQRTKMFTIYRPGKEYKNLKTKTPLGYEASYIAQAQLVRAGDIATLVIKQSTSEALVGDRLFPAEENEFTTNFMPHAPNIPINADIIAVLSDGITQIGQWNSVVLDQGKLQGLRIGDVLEIYRRGRTIMDPVNQQRRDKRVTLPNQLAGQAMVYRVFDNVSYALILNAHIAIHLGDKATNPDEGQQNSPQLTNNDHHTLKHGVYIK